MEQFSREIQLIGKESLLILQQKRVIVFGLGGVGSYAVEALARAGIQHMILVDHDVVQESNINRQLYALHSTIGQRKVDIAEARLHDIFPAIHIDKRAVFIDKETIEDLPWNQIDFIVEAIDTVSAKILIIEKAKNAGIPIISCMGTGNKLYPEQLKISDIAKTSVCPLARVMRYECKKKGIVHFPVVYSTEEPIKVGSQPKSPSSISFVPSVAGLYLARYAILHFLKEKSNADCLLSRCENDG